MVIKDEGKYMDKLRKRKLWISWFADQARAKLLISRFHTFTGTHYSMIIAKMMGQSRHDPKLSEVPCPDSS
jgi:hypothetical protein